MRKRYLWKVTATFIVAVVATALINILVDPYGTFRIIDIKGVNRVKPYPDHDIKTIKNHALRHVAPDALILGNSRAEVGFDPGHPIWREAGYHSVYNAAIPGSSPRTAWDLLERTAQRQPPKFVLIGIDFFDFLIPPDTQSRPPQPSGSLWKEDFRWKANATLTMQALLDSATTIRRQFQNNPEQLTNLGHNPLLEYRDIAKTDGYWVLFRQRAEENAKNHSRKHANLFLKGTHSSPDFDDIRRIVRWTVQNNVDLRLVIYPYHAQLLVMIDELELWPVFEAWKRQINHIVEEEAQQPDSRDRIAQLDFSGFSNYTQDRIPPRGDKKSSTNWYWEAGHFKKELGDIMLERIVATRRMNDATAFGTYLDGKQLENHLRSLRAAKDHFRASNSDMVTEIADLVLKSRLANASATRRK